MPFGIGGQKKWEERIPYCRKPPLSLLSGLVVMTDMSCKATHLTEEIEEKEDADFQLLLCQVFCNHNLFTCL